MRKKNPLELLPGVWRSSVLLCQTMCQVVNDRMSQEIQAAELGVNLREFWILLAAREHDVNQSVLAEALGINPNVMVGLVDSLERKGFGRRRRAENRREYRIEVTPHGEEKCVEITAGWDDRNLRVFSPLTPEDLALFRELAMSVIENHYQNQGITPGRLIKKAHLGEST